MTGYNVVKKSEIVPFERDLEKENTLMTKVFRYNRDKRHKPQPYVPHKKKTRPIINQKIWGTVDHEKMLAESAAWSHVEERLRLMSPYTIKYLESISKFNASEISALLEMYKAIVKNGPFEQGMFRTLFESCFDITDEPILERLYTIFDTLNEGFVSDIEWVCGLSILLRGNFEDRIKVCYAVYDINGDTSLGSDELASCLRGCFPNLAALEDNAIPDPKDEEDNEKEVNDMVFRLFESENEGEITFDAFRKSCIKNPLIIEALGQCLPSTSSIERFQYLFTMEHKDPKGFPLPDINPWRERTVRKEIKESSKVKETSKIRKNSLFSQSSKKMSIAQDRLSERSESPTMSI